MNKIQNLYEIVYVFAHHIKTKVKAKQPIWSYAKQFPHVIYFNINKRRPIDLELPWLAIEAVFHIRRFLNKEMRVLEYGAGGSTLFFSKRIKEIVSIEHDAEWFDLVKNRVRNKDLSNAQFFIVPPTTPEGGQPVRYASITKKAYNGLDFYHYVSVIDQFIDGYFDMIVIDGRARTYCLEHSVRKLRSGGMLVFDNADRIEYQEQIRKQLSGWETYSYTGHVIGGLAIATTNLYIKPLHGEL